MSSINTLGGPAALQQTQAAAAKAPATETSAATRPSVSDRLELSGVSHLLTTLKASGDVRVDKVASIKAQIEAGTYDDDAKLDAATDRMLDEVLR